MNIYISSSYPRRPEAAACARELERAGLSIVSSWHNSPLDTTPEAELSHAAKRALALRDRDELNQAEMLVVLGDGERCYEGGGGKFIEMGMALNAGIRVLLVGHRESVFAHLDEVIYAPDWEAAKAYLVGCHVDSSGRVRIAA